METLEPVETVEVPSSTDCSELLLNQATNIANVNSNLVVLIKILKKVLGV